MISLVNLLCTCLSSRRVSFVVTEASNKISTLETFNTQIIMTGISVLFNGILVAMIINFKVTQCKRHAKKI